jgi:hypothetical protein
MAGIGSTERVETSVIEGPVTGRRSLITPLVADGLVSIIDTCADSPNLKWDQRKKILHQSCGPYIGHPLKPRGLSHWSTTLCKRGVANPRLFTEDAKQKDI